MIALRAALVLAAVGACALEPADAAVPSPDPLEFRDTVYPLLLTDCAFPACHGTAARFFAVYGPGRARLDPATPPYDPPTAEELALSYRRATSMLVAPDGVRRSPLLRKALAADAGGAGHEGDDPWGQAPWPSKADPRFEAIFFWATAGGTAP